MTTPEREEGRRLLAALVVAAKLEEDAAAGVRLAEESLRLARVASGDADREVKAWCERRGIRAVASGGIMYVVRDGEPTRTFDLVVLDPPAILPGVGVAPPQPAPAVAKKKAVKGE